MSKEKGLRYNKGKVEIHQVPTSLVHAAAKVFMYGATKYEKNNFRKGMDWSIPYDALLRHMSKWWNGEGYDEESKLSHLYHAAANISMLIEYEKTCPELDDRYKGESAELTWEEFAELPFKGKRSCSNPVPEAPLNHEPYIRSKV